MANNNVVSGTAVLVTVCVVFVTTVTATVILAFVPGGDNTIALLVAQLAPTITAVATLLRLEQTRKEVNTALNGEMDRKIQTNVSETLEKHGVPIVPEQNRR